jgi:hypothetical protein
VRSGIQVFATSASVVPHVIIEPSTVEISGPRLMVNRVDFVRTDTTRILATDSLPHQVAIDTSGLGVRVRPEQVRARLVMPRKPKR